jgi:acetate kinase
MIVLVANLGSSSFKYKLFDMGADGSAERLLADGAADRIGLGQSAWSVKAGATTAEGVADLMDHAAAIDLHLDELVKIGAVRSVGKIEAIGFKAVHGGPIKDPVQVDKHVLATMERFADVAPQHNPPYIEAMRAFKQKLPRVAQVAAFETGFHQTIPLARQAYGIPHEWFADLGIRRYGFHGASHRYIAGRMAQIAPTARRLISCHLGGSSSISAIEGERSLANSFGMTAQSGVMHASRVGDFDAFALLKLMQSGLDIDTIFHRLGKEGGVHGLSGVSPDIREVEQAATTGNAQAQLALDAFIDSVRHYIGAYLVVLGGIDALVFTGGIGQNGKAIRAAICADLGFVGLRLDPDKNQAADGKLETRIDRGDGAQIWALPTNEELVVARQTFAVLNNQTNKGSSAAATHSATA